MQRADFHSVDAIHSAVGKRVAQSDWLTVTQSMVDDFAQLTHDTQWIHVDPERALRESPFRTTIAHGFLVLSLLTPLIASCVTLPPARLGLNYGFEKVRFIAPVPVGSDIRADFTLDKVTPTADGLQIAWSAIVGVRDVEKPSLGAVWLTRLVIG